MRRTRLLIAAASAIVIWVGSATSASAAGDGASAAGEMYDVNVGSGSQTNASDWEEMNDVNLLGNQLTGYSINSNAGERWSNDVVLNLEGEYPVLANTALDVEVSGNQMSVGGNGGSASSSVSFTHNSGFMNNYGVTAVSVNSGPAASQSVSVNVMANVSLGATPAPSYAPTNP